jgi:hypothetical protein
MEEDARGAFWRGITIASNARLRVGRAIAKTEEEVVDTLMAQRKARGHPDAPPPMATDGKGGYRDALVATWGQAPEDAGHGRPPTRKQAQPDWHYLQLITQVSPIAWQHINFYGRYEFTKGRS